MKNLLDVHIPDLTFPKVSQGENETPWTLRPLLFFGGAAIRANKAAGSIDVGKLGPPIIERIDLVQKIHEEINAALNGGGSKQTGETAIRCIRGFFGWAEAAGNQLNLKLIESIYLKWTDHLIHRVRVVKDLKGQSAYAQARVIGAILDKVLYRVSPILLNTRVPSLRRRRRKRIRGVQAETQDLAGTFLFGHTLLDIVDGLNLEAIWGPLPLKIRIRTGQELEEWSGRIPPWKLRWSNPQNSRERFAAKKAKKRRAAYENDRTLRTRYSVVNLRIEAELLIFIAQTGMNFAQAHQLKVRQYSYKSIIDGFEVRDYKYRRHGEVLFEIFSEYREVFDRYLTWREALFPNDSEGLLFPLIRTGKRAEDTPPNWWRLRSTCKKLGLRFIPPSLLRNTRVNWMLRRSRDLDITSEQAQHSKEILLQSYEEPSLQVAMVEIGRFWQSHDPALQSPAPGVCDGVPVPIVNSPPDAPKPDCIRPTGCLWCQHHRDIDSQDYVWSVTSMRYLKTLALKGFRPAAEGKTNEPARYVEMAIERLTAKLRWFRQSDELRRGWVLEALARIDEAVYHPHWHYLIVAVEGD